MPKPALITDKRGGILIERTISGMLGKGSFNHNNRSFSAKNVDSNRIYLNVTYCEDNIKKVYHELFDGALKRYNTNRLEVTVKLLITMKKSELASKKSCFMK